MLRRLKMPKNEEAERLERARIDRLIEISMSMLENAVLRHDDAMEAGRYEEANNHSETAAWWYGAITGQHP